MRGGPVDVSQQCAKSAVCEMALQALRVKNVACSDAMSYYLPRRGPDQGRIAPKPDALEIFQVIRRPRGDRRWRSAPGRRGSGPARAAETFGRGLRCRRSGRLERRRRAPSPAPGSRRWTGGGRGRRRAGRTGGRRARQQVVAVSRRPDQPIGDGLGGGAQALLQTRRAAPASPAASASRSRANSASTNGVVTPSWRFSSAAPWPRRTSSGSLPPVSVGEAEAAARAPDAAGRGRWRGTPPAPRRRRRRGRPSALGCSRHSASIWLLGQRRAHRRHRRHAGALTGDDVHIALDHDQGRAVAAPEVELACSSLRASARP